MHKSTKWLVGLIIFGALLTGLNFTLHALGYELGGLLSKHVYLFFHIFGAVIFIGNIIVTGVWIYFAERSRQVPVISFAARVVNWADVIFTGPGVILLLNTGIILAEEKGGIYGKSWITAGLILLTLSGVVWAASLIPIQNKLIKLSASTDELSPMFFKLLHRWYFWGIVATILPILALGVMVVKPVLW